MPKSTKSVSQNSSRCSLITATSPVCSGEDARGSLNALMSCKNNRDIELQDIKTLFQYLVGESKRNSDLLAKLSEAESLNKTLQARVEELEKTLLQKQNAPTPQTLNVSPPNSQPMTFNPIDIASFYSCIEESERLRSVVIDLVPESQATSTREKLADDDRSVEDILHYLGVEARPSAVYRMGRPGVRPRKLKVVLPNKHAQNRAVRNAKSLRDYSGLPVRVYLNPSKTREQRVQEANERAARRSSQGAVGGVRPTASPLGPTAHTQLSSQITHMGN